MPRTDERFREAFNALLTLCEALEVGSELPAEVTLAKELEVSRTVVRSALTRMHESGLIDWTGRHKTLLRRPKTDDRLDLQTAHSSIDELERQFLDWMLRFDVEPGTQLNVAELAKKFRVTAHGLQEFLASLSRFGLVRRRSKGGWDLVGFTREYAIELSDFRLMLELNAVAHVLTLPDDAPFWALMDELEAEHRLLAEEIATRFHDFSLLDGRFHSAIGRTVTNRFVEEFQKVITLIFHYHYQWDKKDERERNAAAIDEHLRLIEALKARNERAAIDAARSHLLTSKQTLLNSLRSNDLL